MASLTLIRGLPGSGKTTVATELAYAAGCSDCVFEADQYFMINGEYEFDATKLGQAHANCLANTIYALKNGRDVFVSNTFTTMKEMKPYFDAAKELGVTCQVILCQGNFGSIHAVPDEAIKRMKERFQYDI